MLGLVLLATAACSSNPRAAGPEVGNAGLIQQVDVDNGTSVDLRIIALYGNLQIPIGIVRARQSRPMRLPAGLPSSFRLIAEVDGGGGRLFSEPISATDTRRPTWEIRSNGSASVVYGRGGAMRP
jgi:hypothetical protein